MILRYPITGAGGGGSVDLGWVWVITGAAGGNTPPDTAGAWEAFAPVGQLVVPAAVGDRVEVAVAGLFGLSSNTFWDVAVSVAGSLVWFSANGTSSASVEGDPALYPTSGTLAPAGHFAPLLVEAGHLSAGAVTFALAVKSNGTGKCYCAADYPFRWRALNVGPAGG